MHNLLRFGTCSEGQIKADALIVNNSFINITNAVGNFALAANPLCLQRCSYHSYSVPKKPHKVLEEAASFSLWATVEPNESLCSHLTLAQAPLDM